MNNVDIKAIDCVFVFLGDFGGGGDLIGYKEIHHQK